MINQIKSIAKQTFIYSIGNLSNKLLGFILIPIYTAELSLNEFGMLGLLEITVYTFIQIFQFRLYDAFQRWYYEKQEKEYRKTLFFTSFIFILITNIIFFLIFLKISKNFSNLLFNTSRFSYLIQIALISAFFQIVSSLPQALMRIQEKSLLFVITNTLKLFVTLILTIYLLVYKKRGIEGIFEAQIIGFIVYFIIILNYIIKNSIIRIDFLRLKEMLNYSWPLIFGSLSTVLFNTIDRYSLNFILKENALNTLGLYTLAFKIANLIKLIITDSIKQALPAFIFKQIDNENNKHLYSRIYIYTTIITSFAVVVLSLFSYELLKILVKEQAYWDSFFLIPIIAFGFIFINLKNISTIGLVIPKKTKILASLVFIASLLNVTLNLLLIPKFYAYGAAFATVLSNLFFFISILFIAQKNYFIPYKNYKIIIIIIITIITISISYITISFNIYIRILVKLCLLCMFVILNFKFKVVSKKEFNSLLALIKNKINIKI